MDKEEKKMNIAIAGLGVIGASFAIALKKKGHYIIGLDNDKKTLETALSKGFADEVYDKPNEALGNSDVLLLCLHVRDIPEYLDECLPYLKSGCLISEAASIKGGVYDRIKEAIQGKSYRYCSVHPMAGKESRGIDNADPELFSGCAYMIIADGLDEYSYSEARQIASDVGASHIEKVSYSKHEEIVAKISDLPHLLSQAYIASLEGEASFGGGSHKALARLARSNPKMWADIYMGNRENLLKSLADFEGKLAELKQSLIDGDGEKLYKSLKQIEEKSK